MDSFLVAIIIISFIALFIGFGSFLIFVKTSEEKK